MRKFTQQVRARGVQPEPPESSGVGRALQEAATPMGAAAWAALIAERVDLWRRLQIQIDRAFDGQPILDGTALTGKTEDIEKHLALAVPYMRLAKLIDGQIVALLDLWLKFDRVGAEQVHTSSALADAVAQNKLGEYLKEVLGIAGEGKEAPPDVQRLLLDALGLFKYDLLLARDMREKAEQYPGVRAPSVIDPEAEAAEGKKPASADHSSAAGSCAVGARGSPDRKADRASAGSARKRRAK